MTLRGPQQAPVLRQAVRWKTTPMGWDAAGQSWATGLSGWDAPGDPWYSLTRGIARRRWQRAHAPRELEPLPPGTELGLWGDTWGVLVVEGEAGG